LGIILINNTSCKKADVEINPKVYGHAGTALSSERAVFPPNSEESILYALNALAADGVEVDVQMTNDSVLVLYHDEFVEFNGQTCITEISWSEVQEINETQKFPIIRLARLAAIMSNNPKSVMLDLKHYDHCNQIFENSETFNWAVNNELSELLPADKARFILNSRNIDLLIAIDDDSLMKSFETDDVELGVTYADAYGIDLILIKLSDFIQEDATLLDNAHVNYGFFGVKTKKEIKATANFKPRIIISDNIAATKGYYN
jgi:glycerophosphoryl diester phosphodiesterase